ncbi:24191_t:CDS:2, partial [Gigaspora rosea]
ISHEKWIECKINEGLITKYKFEEFTEFKMIGSGACSIVYKTTLKITGIKHIISVGFHENIIKFYGISKYKDQMDPNVVKN